MEFQYFWPSLYIWHASHAFSSWPQSPSIYQRWPLVQSLLTAIINVRLPELITCWLELALQLLTPLVPSLLVNSLYYNLVSNLTTLTELDHHFSPFTHNMDTVVQITVFLGIFTTTIASASRTDGDFIIGLINILVFYAFLSPENPIDGFVNLRHWKILTEMSENMHNVLSKFNLESKTTVYAVLAATRKNDPPTTWRLCGNNLEDL